MELEKIGNCLDFWGGIEDYIARAGEYRSRVKQMSKKYQNITILDPKDLYCDNKYCYAIKDGKMLYADDDHHSIDGTKIQAKYFMNKIFKQEIISGK